MSHDEQIFAVTLQFVMLEGTRTNMREITWFFDWLVQFPMFSPSRCCPLGDERRPPFLSEICWGTGLSF